MTVGATPFESPVLKAAHVELLGWNLHTDGRQDVRVWRHELEALVLDLAEARRRFCDASEQLRKAPDELDAMAEESFRVIQEKAAARFAAAPDAVAALLERLRALDALAAAMSGCSEGRCDITGKRGGQHTNAGCRCLSSVPPKMRPALRRLFDLLRVGGADVRSSPAATGPQGTGYDGEDRSASASALDVTDDDVERAVKVHDSALMTVGEADEFKGVQHVSRIILRRVLSDFVSRRMRARRRSAFVLFNNDSPELAYDDERAAQTEAKVRQAAAKRDARQSELSAYWHVHEVPCAGGAE